MSMVAWIAGYMMGLLIGIVIGRMQKPWSERSVRERKFLITLIIVGIVILGVGIVVFALI